MSVPLSPRSLSACAPNTRRWSRASMRSKSMGLTDAWIMASTASSVMSHWPCLRATSNTSVPCCAGRNKREDAGHTKRLPDQRSTGYGAGRSGRGRYARKSLSIRIILINAANYGKPPVHYENLQISLKTDAAISGKSGFSVRHYIGSSESACRAMVG